MSRASHRTAVVCRIVDSSIDRCRRATEALWRPPEPMRPMLLGYLVLRRDAPWAQPCATLSCTLLRRRRHAQRHVGQRSGENVSVFGDGCTLQSGRNVALASVLH